MSRFNISCPFKFSASDAVLNYLTKQNRPYSAGWYFLKLFSAISQNSHKSQVNAKTHVSYSALFQLTYFQISTKSLEKR